MIGDIVYNSLNTKNRLKCDGSLHRISDYPELASYLSDVKSSSIDVSFNDTPSSLSPNIGVPWCIEFSPDGSLMAVGGDANSNLKIYDTATWSVVSGTPTLASEVRDISFSPDGKYMAVAMYYSPFLFVCDTETWTEIDVKELSNQPAYVRGEGVNFSPDGKWLIYIDIDYVFQIRTDTWTHHGLLSLGAAGDTYRGAFSNDGKKFAVCGRSTALDQAVIHMYDYIEDGGYLEFTHMKTSSTTIPFWGDVCFANDDLRVMAVYDKYIGFYETTKLTYADVVEALGAVTFARLAPLNETMVAVSAAVDATDDNSAVIASTISYFGDSLGLSESQISNSGSVRTIAIASPPDRSILVYGLGNNLAVRTMKKDPPAGYFHTPTIESRQPGNVFNYPVLIQAKED